MVGHRRCKVLVVDDQQEFTSLVEEALAPEMCDTAVARNGRDAIAMVEKFRPDVILLDVVMPGMDGMETLRQIRSHWDAPVLMLTGINDEDAVVRFLEAGADDYVTKPFSLRELKARVRAAQRRADRHHFGPPGPLDDDILIVADGDIVIHRAAAQVAVKSEAVDLAPLEYKLLLVLAENEGRVLSHAYLLREVWGLGFEDAGACLKMAIGRLRSKLGDDPRSPCYIHTRRSVGYLLEKH